MAKRANPYIEDFIPQSKVHVGAKQFNNNEGRLQKVYEKTLNLLYKGAKKSYNCPDKDPTESTQSLTSKDKFKQLFIGKNGSLEHLGAVISSDSSIPASKCPCGSTTTSASCGYCEAALCCHCALVCQQCCHNYCHKCAIAEYEGTAVCVSCYH